ncbi:MAG: hypothetical protein M1115_01855, partial [Actinobacteria bacterium]|nr:hypothetical protein [Actinomycetota bacterium]
EYLLAGVGFAALASAFIAGWRLVGDRPAGSRHPAGDLHQDPASPTGDLHQDPAPPAGDLHQDPASPTGYLHQDPALQEGSSERPGGMSTALIKAPRGAAGAVTVPLVAAVAALLVVLPPLVRLPSWMPFSNVAPSFVPEWVHWNYSGYQGKSAWPEYHALMETMAQVGDTYGCGRAMWEYSPSENRFGTTMSLMLLPYWTSDCVDSMEGLLFESSATTPYHFINQAELSLEPSEAMVGLPYGPLDVAEGVRHLQILGVRYYMACTTAAQQQASADPALSLIATSGPWEVHGQGCVPGSPTETWKIYLVHSSSEVAPLAYQPVVGTGIPSSGTGWLHDALSWYDNPAKWDVMIAAKGPASWHRVPATEAASLIPRKRLPALKVSDVVEKTSSISFDVSRLGVPVVVRTSYFPNWHARGAEGPYRAFPNLMVVVPTSHHVVLYYGETPVNVAGLAITGISLVVVGLFLFTRLGRRQKVRAAISK